MGITLLQISPHKDFIIFLHCSLIAFKEQGKLSDAVSA